MPDQPSSQTPSTGLGLLALAELQDHLLLAGNDLQRLEALLADACASLMTHFHEAARQVGRLDAGDGSVRDELAGRIAGAVTALQFQDLASQLVGHTCKRLEHCADRLGQAGFAPDDGDPAPLAEAPRHPNPVTQSEMDAGSVELF